jgi:hypothetical protein
MDILAKWWIVATVGIGLEFLADIAMRDRNAPPEARRKRQTPWGNRELFTPLGYQVRVVGFGITIISAVMALAWVIL